MNEFLHDLEDDVEKVVLKGEDELIKVAKALEAAAKALKLKVEGALKTEGVTESKGPQLLNG
jgi:hypothetical protein